MGQSLPKSDSPPVHPLMIDGQAWNKEAVMEIICDRLATSSDGLRKIISEGHEGYKLPALSAVCRWLNEDDALREQYAHAKAAQMDFMAEEILDIADASELDMVESPSGDMKLDGEHVQRSRLRVDTRKWLMAKLAPKKYGDKQELNVSGGLAVVKASEADLGVL